MIYPPASCDYCPRVCGANRAGGETGYCGVPGLRVARAAPHFWEEPCISGERGSGCVFFSGCPLRCVYCQNSVISEDCVGVDVSVEQLADVFRKLEAQGVHNLNLVTASHVWPWVVRALELAKPGIPVVWNTSGYETAACVDALDGLVQIWLPDLKYRDPARAERYSAAPDYFDVAISAIRRMQAQVGAPVFGADRLLTSGVIVRHMVLPKGKADSLAVVEALADAVPVESILLSLLFQYIPAGHALEYAELGRRVSTYEYSAVADRAAELGFRGFTQGREAADPDYIPLWDFSLRPSEPEPSPTKRKA